jgi:hypothetical protein
VDSVHAEHAEHAEQAEHAENICLAGEKGYDAGKEGKEDIGLGCTDPDRRSGGSERDGIVVVGERAVSQPRVEKPSQ